MTTMTQLIITVFIFVLGVCLGSFANVLIYRLPKGMGFVGGSSVCPTCGIRIMPKDLIPVVSYIILGGKCRSCGAGISARYPAVELISGIIAVFGVHIYGLTFSAVLFFFIALVLLVISFIDARHMLIPDELVAAFAVLAVVYAAIYGNAQGIGVSSRIIGFFVLSLPMLVLTFLIPNAFGGGDIKLFAASGILLGARQTLLAGFIAVCLGSIAGIYLKYIRHDESLVHIAFGQYICIGVFLAFIYGKEILQFYLSLIL